jgi:hypothetical protein
LIAASSKTTAVPELVLKLFKSQRIVNDDVDWEEKILIPLDASLVQSTSRCISNARFTGYHPRSKVALTLLTQIAKLLFQAYLTMGTTLVGFNINAMPN